MKKKWLSKDEEGAVLVVSLIMLAFLSLLGIAATTTSSIEIQIAANDRAYKHNFYMAEAALWEAAQRIQNGGNLTGFVTHPDDIADKDFLIQVNANTWIIDTTKREEIVDWVIENAISSSVDSAHAGYRGIGPITTSAGNLTTGATIRTYYIFGFYDKPNEPNKGRVIVDAGYRVIMGG